MYIGHIFDHRFQHWSSLPYIATDVDAFKFSAISAGAKAVAFTDFWMLSVSGNNEDLFNRLD